MVHSLQKSAILVFLPALVVVTQVGPGERVSPAAPSSKTWVGRHQEVEEYLRTAECVGLEDFPARRSLEAPLIFRRCTFRAGGPVARMAWKPLPPGIYRGFWESYKSEIAAYELDKLLKTDMVPPAVERELQGHRGAAVFWVENVVTLKALPSVEASERPHWDQQLVRMRMFSNLAGDKDRNLQNILRDAAWDLISVDYVRAFRRDTELPYNLNRIDEDYWNRIERLTRAQLDAALRPWLDEQQIQAIVDRRDAMRRVIIGLRRN